MCCWVIVGKINNTTILVLTASFQDNGVSSFFLQNDKPFRILPQQEMMEVPLVTARILNI